MFATPSYPSPTRWQDEVIYFLLPDRFSDEGERPLLDRTDLAAARPLGWDPRLWGKSGAERFQGGTLRGVTSRLDYLSRLGVTALWLGPVWKQRAERDDYHGYAIQDFSRVDPRIGEKADLVDLVRQAHDEYDMRIILDVVINHSGENWLYQEQLDQGGAPNGLQPPPPIRPDHVAYSFGAWVDGDGQPMAPGALPLTGDDGVWPDGVLQHPDAYHRAGATEYSDDSDPWSAFANFRRGDWCNRDLALTDGPLGDRVLQQLIDVWTTWLEETDCDGFRIDTYKHFRVEEGRRFCSAVREFAEARGKDNFLLLAEVAGSEDLQNGYLTTQAGSLSAALSIGEGRARLRAAAGGSAPPSLFFGLWPDVKPLEPGPTSEEVPVTDQIIRRELPAAGSHRGLGSAFVYSLDDHDNLGAPWLRFETEHPGLTVPAVAMTVFCLGIPCLYYGTEQALSVPADLQGQLEWFNVSGHAADRYLREAMFGPDHPRRSGRAGGPQVDDPLDSDLPGFGAFGTSGCHVFDVEHPVFRRISRMLQVRRSSVPLRRGRQYLRDVRPLGQAGFAAAAAGGLSAWSRILGRQEVLCVANLDPGQAQGGDVTIDAGIASSRSPMNVLLDTGVTEDDPTRTLPVSAENGRLFVRVPTLGPAEVLVLSSSRPTSGKGEEPMPDTVRVVLRSRAVPDDAVITVCTSADGWKHEEPCLWQEESQQWVADVPLGDHAGDLELKFRRGGVWQSGLNLQIMAAQLQSPQFFGELEVSFLAPQWPVVDMPSPSRRIFDPAPDLPDPDVIVVGSGIGGGVVAYALTELLPVGRPLQVLVLEAGGYLFPTHVGNLPRREPSQVAEPQQPWQVWSDYRTPVLDLGHLTEIPEHGPEISRALNLGGRSLFWGCLAPRAQPWELADWPKLLTDDLPTYYEAAETLMRVRTEGASPYGRLAVKALAAATSPSLAAFNHDTAPIAAQLLPPIPAMIPTGMFSTAELLIERKLADGGQAFRNLNVLLNQEVVGVECTGLEGDRVATAVTARDRTSGRLRTFRTATDGMIILAAGSTGSPLIARGGALVSPASSPLVGVGLTDHAIWVQPFKVPQSDLEDSWFTTRDAAVILSRPKPETSGDYPFNVKLALNTHLTLARMVDPGDFPDLVVGMPAEIVFLLSSTLIDANRVNGLPSQPAVTITGMANPPSQVMNQIGQTTEAMLAVFGGSNAGDGFVASFGGVGHEVGTMRMTTRASPGVVDTDLLINGTRNVYVCDLSVFPTSPAANPSLTLAALALRLANHLRQALG